MVWLVSAVLVAAASIDGRQLRVPNWLTFPYLMGWSSYAGSARWRRRLSVRWRGWPSALITLLPLYAIGHGHGGCQADGRRWRLDGPSVHALRDFVMHGLVGDVSDWR